MSQIMQRPISSAGYLDTLLALASAKCMSQMALHWLGNCFSSLHRSGAALMPGNGHSRSAYAGPWVDQLMRGVVRSTREPIAVTYAGCICISNDRRRLLNPTSFNQFGKSDVAERALRNALLSAQGGAILLYPLEGFGALATRAKLIFQRHLTVANQGFKAVKVQSDPSPRSVTLHLT